MHCPRGHQRNRITDERAPQTVNLSWGSSTGTKVKNPETQIPRQIECQSWKVPACLQILPLCFTGEETETQRAHASLRVQGSFHKLINVLGRWERILLNSVVFIVDGTLLPLPRPPSIFLLGPIGPALSFPPRSRPPQCCPLPWLLSL